MYNYNIQFFGGRGASGDGESLGGGSGGSVNIKSETDVWSYRHKRDNEPFVDAINSSMRGVTDDFPGLMGNIDRVNATEMGGADKTHVLGVWSPDKKSLGINQNYTNIEKMNKVYDKSIESGYHPNRGNKTGTEAVTFHEAGHAITDYVGTKIGAKNIDDASKTIVNNAYKNSKGTGGTKAWAGKISKYAQESYAECIAEAVTDHYCNGNKASSTSKAIMKELFKYK